MAKYTEKEIVHQVGFIYKIEITHLYTVQIWTINIDLCLNAVSSKNMLMNVIYWQLSYSDT